MKAFGTKSKTNPVILVPGITASVLEAQLEKGHGLSALCKHTDGNWFKFWLNPTNIAFDFFCFVKHMTLDFKDESQCVSDIQGMTSRAVDYGGLDGVDIIDPMMPPVFQIKVFDSLIKRLSSVGFVRNVSLRSATYDWRKFGDRCYTMNQFEKLQGLIEDTYSINNNTKVDVVCHSMG